MAIIAAALVAAGLIAGLGWLTYHYAPDEQLRRWGNQKTLVGRFAANALRDRFERRRAAAAALARAIRSSADGRAGMHGLALGWYGSAQRGVPSTNWGFGAGGEFVDSSPSCAGEPSYTFFGHVKSAGNASIVVSGSDMSSDRRRDLQLARFRIGGQVVLCQREWLDDILNAPDHEIIPLIHLHSRQFIFENSMPPESWPAIELPPAFEPLRAKRPIEATIVDELQIQSPSGPTQQFRINAGIDQGVFIGLGFWPANEDGSPTYCGGARLTVVGVEAQTCVAIRRLGVRCADPFDPPQTGTRVRAGR